MRLFAALEVPGAVREPLDRAVAPLREGRGEGRSDLKWTPDHQWHLTVAFLGSVSEEQLPAAVGALGSAAASAPAEIELSLAGGGRFGKRVLWVGVDDRPEGAVALLGTAARGALNDAGLPVDEKEVHPHLTLTRSRGRRGPGIDEGLVEAVPQLDAAWTVDELVLFSSIRQGHGQPNRYEAIDRFPLGASERTPSGRS